MRLFPAILPTIVFTWAAIASAAAPGAESGPLAPATGVEAGPPARHAPPAAEVRSAAPTFQEARQRGDSIHWRRIPGFLPRPDLEGAPSSILDTVRISMGLAPKELPYPVVFRGTPGSDDPWFLGPGQTWDWRWTRSLEARVRDRIVFQPRSRVSVEPGQERFVAVDTTAFLPEPREPVRRGRTGRLPGAPPDTTPPPAPDTVPGDSASQVPGEEVLPEFFTDVADLGLRLRGRGELGGDWVRFRPCDVVAQFNCDPSIIPQLDPDVQFGLQVQGTISERVHVNVDFDQTREFSAANNINVWYQGLEDEILQRLEVGDVTFSLPESRFLTQGIPAGNFGFRATGQVGPLELQTVWAQQKGDLSEREFRLSGAGGSQGFVQEDTLVIDDADYVEGQFFYLFHPTAILDFPHIDILNLDPSQAPASVVPGGDPIQLYRFENDPVTRQQVEGYVQADAVATLEGDTVTESGWFRFLQPGVDYFVHPSGLWLALRSPLRNDEMLAVTYVTQSGDTVGDYNPERIHNAGGRPELRLLQASQGLHQPGRPTWDIEMHNVYRVSGSNDVDVNSVELTISLGELSAGRTFVRGPTGDDITLLRLLGLDEESPIDQLDRSFVYKPADDAFEEQPPVNGTFIIFPTLRPFQDPPPVDALGLSADQTDDLLGADENRTIYEAVDPFDRDNGGLYRLTIPFRVRSEGVVSSFSLGALGIRDGSERITLGNQVLVAREDYIIDYDLGQVTLLDAQNLFAANPEAEIRATFEQKSIFQIAPTSVFGLNATWDLGERGDLNLMTLIQSEDDLVRRPQLGVEASSVFLGGVNGDLSFGASWLDRALDWVPGLTYAGESSIRVQGELAVSVPDPNTQGDVFLDDFDATNELPLSTNLAAWRLGSAPEFREGAQDFLPPDLGVSDVEDMAWQHTWIETDGSIFEGLNAQEDIDRQIRVAGNPNLRESILFVTFGLEAGDLTERRFANRRWRSITTNLSTTGQDLTKTEFLEFYVAQGDSMTLVIDLGQVSEDAFFVDQDRRANGTREDGEVWGLDVLDQEADPREGELWNRELDQNGNWDEACAALPDIVAYPIASSDANCTRNNGRRDSEDLDGDGNLDQTERYMRYVVKLDGTSRFLARDRNETGTPFRLYRIPIRGAGAVNVGGQFTEADFRAVKHLRITVTSDRSGGFFLARPRLVGSRWVKRGREGVVRGIVGDTVGTGGSVSVTPVSALTEGGAYIAPPGVIEQLDDPSQAFGGQGIEFNEKSLGLDYESIPGGERVEVWSRFPQRPRNFLIYRQARIWALARRGDWGADGPTSFFVKVGNDPENFYIFRTRLEEIPDENQVISSDWLPEIEINFEEWFDLRRQAEEDLILNPPTPGDPPRTLWNADSTYAVVLKDRGRAPNLASVRELSMGVWNEGDQPTTGEVWINEFRLSAPVRETGTASYVDVDVRAADVLSTRVSVQNRGALFRQLEGDPSYQDDRSLSLNSTLRMDRFLPAGWGIDLPVQVTHTQTDRDPTFLTQSDVRADRLEGLRDAGSSRTRLNVSFRKRTPAANPILNAVLSGLEARAGYTTASSSTETSESESKAFDARLGYDRRLEPREFSLVPDFLDGVLELLLPGFLEERVIDSKLRWSPERLSFGSSYFNQENQARRFDQILELPGDTAITPTVSPREGLQTDAQVNFRPLESLTADLTFLTSRDLLEPEDVVNDPAIQPLLEEERRTLGGVDLGWEVQRNVRTQLNFRPRIFGWLRTEYRWSSSYSSNRNSNFVEQRLEGEDTVRVLQRNVNGQRTQGVTTSLDPGRFMGAVLGDEPGEGSFFGRVLRRSARAVEPLEFTWQGGLITRYNRQAVDPGTGFQLGLGGPEDFRTIGSDTAATLTDRDNYTAGSGVRLPLGLGLQVQWSRSDSRTFDTRSDRESSSETWPDVRAQLSDVPLPGFVRPVIRRISVSSGFQKRVQSSSFGLSQQERLQEDRTIPLDVTLRFGGNTNISYRGSFQEGDGTDPTGFTERVRTTHSVSMTSSFTPPGEAWEKLQRPMRLSLQYRFAAQADCRISSGREDQSCVPFVDQLNRTFNLTLDTQVGGVDLGLQTSFTNRQSFIGQRAGSTQFQLGFFGEFLFAAGNLGLR